MKGNREFFPALGVAAAALGLDIASGRAIAAFYGQLAGAGWLGVLLSGLMFGLMTGLVCALAQRSGAADLPALLGCLGGGFIPVLHTLVLLAAACMLAAEAGHIGALVLPVHRAGIYAGLTAVFLAAAVALTSERAVHILGASFIAALGAYLAALLCFGSMPEGRLHYALELRLGNSIPIAILLAALHAAVGTVISAGISARQDFGVRPIRLGLLAGLAYTALLALGNGVFHRHEPILLRLRYPFAALSAGWGMTGFCLSALVIFLGCTSALAGILRAVIPKRKSRISGEN